MAWSSLAMHGKAMQGEARDVIDDAPATCSRCGSDALEGVEHEDFTGVEMDGFRERRLWRGYRCLDCGNVEEDRS